MKTNIKKFFPNLFLYLTFFSIPHVNACKSNNSPLKQLEETCIAKIKNFEKDMQATFNDFDNKFIQALYVENENLNKHSYPENQVPTNKIEESKEKAKNKIEAGKHKVETGMHKVAENVNTVKQKIGEKIETGMHKAESGNDKLKDKLETKMHEVADNVDSSKHKVGEKIENGKDKLESGKDKLKDKLETKMYELGDNVDSSKQKIGEKLETGNHKLHDKFATGMRQVAETLESGKQKASENLQTDKQKLHDSFQAGKHKLQNGIQIGKQKAGEILNNGKHKAHDILETSKHNLEAGVKKISHKLNEQPLFMDLTSKYYYEDNRSYLMLANKEKAIRITQEKSSSSALYIIEVVHKNEKDAVHQERSNFVKLKKLQRYIKKQFNSRIAIVILDECIKSIIYDRKKNHISMNAFNKINTEKYVIEVTPKPNNRMIKSGRNKKSMLHTIK